MGSFIFQGVINVGIQILLLIVAGWLFARCGAVQPEKFIPQINLFVLQVALPSFNLYLLGIKLPLQTASAWQSLSAFIIWGTIVQVAITIYTWLFAGGRLATAGTLNMHLLMLNFGIIGYIALVSILGPDLGSIALLTGVIFFLQMVPYSIAAFEWEKFVMAHPVHVEHMAAQQQLEQQIEAQIQQLQQQQERSAEEKLLSPQRSYQQEQEQGGHPRPVAEQAEEAAAGGADPGALEARSMPYSFTSVMTMKERGAADNDDANSERSVSFAWSKPWAKYGVSTFGGDDAYGGGAAAAGVGDDALADQGGLAAGPHPWGHSHKMMHVQHYEYALTHLLSTGPEAKVLGRGCTVVPYDHFAAPPAPAPWRLPAPEPGEAAAAAATNGGAAYKSKAETVVSFALSARAGGTVAEMPTTPLPAAHGTFKQQPAAAALGTFRQPDTVLRLSRLSQATALAFGPPPTALTLGHQQGGAAATFKSQAAAAAKPPDNNPHRQERTVEAAALWDYHAHPHHAVWVLNTAPAEQHRVLKEATGRVVAHYGNTLKAVWNFLVHHEELWAIVKLVLFKPIVWTVLLSVAISASGLREFLDPAARHYVEGLGWVQGGLHWLASVTVPASLFSNGAWLYGKNILPKKRDIPQVCLLFLLKLVVLPLLMVGCCKAMGLDDGAAAAMTLVTLSPPAASSFAIAVQYNVGVEMVTFFNIVGVIFIAPLLIGWANFLSGSGIFPDFQMGAQ